MSKVILSGFADEIDKNLTVQMNVMEKLGIHHIEMRGVNGKNLCDCTLEEAKQIKAQMDARGFSLSAIGSPIGKIQITDPFEPHLKQFEHVLDLANLFGTKYIRLFSFYIPKGEDPAKYRDEVMKRMAAFVKAAEGRDVILMHENEKGIYGDMADRCLDIIRTINSPILRVTFDPANFVQCDEEVYPHAYELLSPYLTYMHIKDAVYSDHHVVPAGEGDGRVLDVLNALAAKKFDGFLSLEPHLCKFTGFTDLESEPDMIKKAESSEGARLFGVAADALRGLMAKAGLTE